MILLDSDHISTLQIPDSKRRDRLLSRLDGIGNETVATTIVTVEENMRGWLASIAKERQVRRLAKPYRELRKLFAFYQDWVILDFDDDAISRFEALKASRIHIGTMDLKIASIAFAHNALLLTANKRDFEQVPGLRFENWMDPE